jgi:cytochrome c556
MIRHKAIGAAATVIAVVVAGVVFAHEGMTGVVAQRMEGMKAMAADLKAISKMVESSTDLDVGELSARVGALHRNCHDAKGLFVAAEHDKTSRRCLRSGNILTSSRMRCKISTLRSKSRGRLPPEVSVPRYRDH